MKNDLRSACALAVCLLSAACAGGTVPDEFGWFAVDHGEARALARSEQLGRRGELDQTIFGVKELSGINLTDRDAHFIVFTTDAPAIAESIALSRLERAGGRRVQASFNPDKHGIHGPTESVPLGIVPSEEDDRLLRLVPKEPLSPGPYALHVGAMVGIEQPAVYDFVVIEDLDARTREERIETIRVGRLEALTFNAARHGADAIPYLLELALLFHWLGPEGPEIESPSDQTPGQIVEALAEIGRTHPDAFAAVLSEKYTRRMRNLEESCVISHIFEGSPAERAGMLALDVVIAIDGRGIENVNDLNDFLDATMTPAPAQELVVRVRRQDTEVDLRLIEGPDGQFGFSVGAPDNWVPDREALAMVSAAAVAAAAVSGGPILSTVRELSLETSNSQRKWLEWLFPGLSLR